MGSFQVSRLRKGIFLTKLCVKLDANHRVRVLSLNNGLSELLNIFPGTSPIACSLNFVTHLPHSLRLTSRRIHKRIKHKANQSTKHIYKYDHPYHKIF